MPLNVFGNSLNNSDNEIDTSSFEQKPYLRSNYIESNTEEDIDLKNHNRNKNLPDPLSIRETVSKNYVDYKFNDPSILKNTKHIDPNDRNITNVRFLQVNQVPQTDSHSTAKLYVDKTVSNAIDEPSFLRLDPDEKLEQDSIILNSTLTSPKTRIEVPTKNYVDNNFNDPIIIKNTDHVDFIDKNLGNIRWIRVNKMPVAPNDLVPKLYDNNASSDVLGYVNGLHESSRNRRDLSSVFNDQDNEFDNNILTNLDSVTINRVPNQDNEQSSKKYLDDSIGEPYNS